MPTRDDVELLVHARNTVVGAAQDELVKVFFAVEGKDPRVIRDVLIETVPAIVGKHGDAAAAAADWYMQLREKDIPGAAGFQVSLGEPVADDVVRENVRYAAKFLFGSDPAMTITALQGAIGRHVKYSEMSTIWQMGAKDTLNVRFALVPRPPMTCAWCSMLSSRGWAYESEGSGRDAMHTGCDCSVVPSWDSEKAHIDGYDPERDYRRYKEAKDGLGKGASDKEITERMREMFPDDYTNGVTPDRGKRYGDGTITADKWRRQRAERARDAKKGAYGHVAYARRIPPVKPARRPHDWPKDAPLLDDAAWNHILYGNDGSGGHLPGYGWVNNGNEFPAGWTLNDIGHAAKELLSSPQSIEQLENGGLKYEGAVNGIPVRAIISVRKNGVKRVSSFFRESR